MADRMFAIATPIPVGLSASGTCPSKVSFSNSLDLGGPSGRLAQWQVTKWLSGVVLNHPGSLYFLPLGIHLWACHAMRSPATQRRQGQVHHLIVLTELSFPTIHLRWSTYEWTSFQMVPTSSHSSHLHLQPFEFSQLDTRHCREENKLFPVYPALIPDPLNSWA